MSGRGTLIQLVTKVGIGFAALFLVGVLLAAIPNHHAPRAAVSDATSAAQQGQSPNRSSMSGTSMDGGEATSGEQEAMHDMAHMDHAYSPHLRMTAARPLSPADQQRAKEIANELRAGIEKYKDYQVALNEGYKIFLPDEPQPEYHFTNYWNGFLEALSFEPVRPTSLLYKKTADGYQLVGAMYTMPKSATEEQLNERVPLSVATWHQHTNLCLPSHGQLRNADHAKFGLRGSIATQEACDAAGGRFFPVIFGWMVHVYPYGDSPSKIFAMHHHD
jgi:hypothetical protein